MATEREAMRANAGGAPEALKSANGKATVKIGGDFRTRYTLGWSAGYNPSDTNDNSRYTRSQWDIWKAELNFTIDFTPDTQAYIALRPDRGSGAVGQFLDQAWWQWGNIGGTGFSAKVGLQDLDIGMFNGDDSPWDRVMISDPYVKDVVLAGGFSGSYLSGKSFSSATDLTALGASVAYKWDQIKVSAGICGQQVSTDPEADLGVTTDGTPRNIGIENHYLPGAYDPCWVEKLHLQASYFGQSDNGQNSSTIGYYREGYNTPNTRNVWNDNRINSFYVPGVDFGASYIEDRWAVYAEGSVVSNPLFIKNSFMMAYSIGADYSLTEKLKIGGMLDWNDTELTRVASGGNNVYLYSLRAALGAKYDFGNGLYVQAQYCHEWVKQWGAQNNDCKDLDQITLQTGCKF